jgi:hypothetical protein
MATWDDLKPILARLRDQRPGVLTGYPSPEADEDRRPPFMIQLAPWGADTARELHQRFGDDVELTVGALPYPVGRRPERPAAAGGLPGLLDPAEITAALDGPAVVGSGHTLQHGLVLGNLTGRELRLETNGQVNADVVDPRTGEIVGGFSGWQIMPLVTFGVAPGESKRIPLLIGTASFTPRLGYLVPAGDWGVQATLFLGQDAGESRSSRTPVFPLTITA